MHENYDDIKSRIAEEPTWYDQNGTPRYGPFKPQQCPNIYAPVVCLFRIGCQDCGQEFMVEMHADYWSGKMESPPSKWHYGDPPIHDCVGDTMNCDDLEILQVWTRINPLKNWKRHRKLEHAIEEEATDETD